jgi:hypothetical protein
MSLHKNILTIPLAGLLCAASLHLSNAASAETPTRWSAGQANAWQAEHKWLVGCNFSPSTAINQLEMWQADTFDPATIDRELGWAESLGFTSVRVFLHNLLWQQESDGFLKRMEQFLTMADKHHISVMFVFFDSCWDPNPRPGKQHAPTLGLHNSGWVQSPGKEFMANPARLDELKPYVQGVIGHFKNDRRICFWDLYNEPDNDNGSSYGKEEPKDKEAVSRLLLEKTFAWARTMNPSQPLSSGVWRGNWEHADKLSPMEKLQLEESDIITFHCYGKADEVKRCVDHLRRYQRPILCTEYMARPVGSTFDPVLGYFRQEKVGAYNWGFVSGKTQTIYPWDSWGKAYTNEPPVWFHDIFRADGSAYRPEEVSYIKNCTRAERASASAAPSSAAAKLAH